MGCLSLTIQDRTLVDIEASAECRNTGLVASADCRNASLSVETDARNTPPAVSVIGIAPTVSFAVVSVNIRPSVSVGLVCGVNLDGTWQYLQVEDGCLITIDGQYMKVLRAN